MAYEITNMTFSPLETIGYTVDLGDNFATEYPNGELAVDYTLWLDGGVVANPTSENDAVSVSGGDAFVAFEPNTLGSGRYYNEWFLRSLVSGEVERIVYGHLIVEDIT